MNASHMEQILHELGFNYLRTVNSSEDTNFMFCCPWHGERHPSCGISVNKEVGACFACGQTFTLVYLVSYMKEISMKQAADWLDEKFNVSKQKVDIKNRIRRIDDDVVGEKKPIRCELPTIRLAPYKSGKIQHKYLLDRGFTIKTFKRFKFGWDTKKKRITIPIFWQDDVLAGFVGRAVLEQKINGKDNPEYKAVYGDVDRYLFYEFEKSKILFPLNLFELPEDKSVILVEGSLDAPWMYQLGFNNTLSILGSKITKEQIEILNNLGVRDVILMLDNDYAGEKGTERAYNLLKDDFLCYKVKYPCNKNDPQELTREEVVSMLRNKTPYRTLSVKRIE